MRQSKLKNESLAIVGIGCRFPGGAKDPTSFWDLLCNGIDAICDIPANRWDNQRFYDPNPKKPGKMIIKQAGFLKENHEYFDPLFFGISPREAETLDPQQRLLLEVVWEAIDDAGFNINNLKQSRTGVFIGGFCLDSMLTNFNSDNRHLINSSTSTCSAMAMLANRISYVFDFHGPSLAIDTACSSSLVACHYACQSIWNNESTIAIVGGVNTMTRPEFPIIMSKGQFLSKHCRCMTFDERADGYTRGEGAGIVVLKPLKRALADGDRIYATIKASGINQDGHTPSMTLPSQDSQVKLLEQVYRSAGVTPDKIHYVEAHGTGTKAGDSIEALALNSVLSRNRERDSKCFVGSVKTNIGHLEAAAGAAGLIKAALCLKHGKVPGNLHFETPNSDIPFDELCLKVPTKLEELSAKTDGHLYAGVNSFGYGGTNAHLLLEAAPNSLSHKSEVTPKTSGSSRLVPISARSEEALIELARIYHEFITNDHAQSDTDLDSLIYALSLRRSHHPHRLALLVNSKKELAEKLNLFSHGQLTAGMAAGKASEYKPGLVFVFTGMGPQWQGMGQDLMKDEPVFKKTFECCSQLFKEVSGISLLAELGKDPKASRFHETSISQTLNFAIQISLTELWKSRGVLPDAVIGHSVGEVAAAYVSGCLSLKEALMVTFYRSRLQEALAGKGAMLAIALGEEDCKTTIQGYPNVGIAAINSPNSVTISGVPEAIDHMAQTLLEKQVFTKQLNVNIAYHSDQMGSLQDKLYEDLATLKPNFSKLPFYSTVTGDQLNDNSVDASYWWQNMRQPVLFEQAIRSLIRDGHYHFLEVGPHPVLSPYIKECLFAADKTGATFHSLNRHQSDLDCTLEALGDLFVNGYPIDWKAITPHSRYTLSLPAYPWQKERYWLESEKSRQDRLGQTGHAFLNEDKFMPIPTWEVELNHYFFPYLPDHRLNGTVIFPASSYVEAGLIIHRHHFGDEVCVIEDIRFSNMLAFDADKVKKIQSQFNPQTNTFAVYSRNVGEHPEWTQHAAGRLLQNSDMKIPEFNPSPENWEPCSVDELYRKFEHQRLEYGNSFKNIVKLWRKEDEVLATICNDADISDDTTFDLLHPTVLDACFQTFLTPQLASSNFPDCPFVPYSIRQLRFYAVPKQEIRCYTKITQTYSDEVWGDITLFDENNKVIAELKSICLKLLGKGEARHHSLFSTSIYEVKWEEKPSATSDFSKAHGDWLIFDLKQNWSDLILHYYPHDHVQPFRVVSGPRFRQKSDDNLVIAPKNVDHMQKLFEATEHKEFNTILYFWSLEPNHSQDRTNEAVNRCVPLLHLAQELSRKQHPVTIIIATYKTQAVQSKDVVERVSDASIWGLARVIANEHPNIHCKLIDLDSLVGSEVKDFLAAEIISESSDNEVAIRKGRRWINRLARTDWKDDESQIELLPVPSKTRVTLEVERMSNLDTFYFCELPRLEPGPNEVEIRIHSTALNFKDLLKCYGRLPHLITRGTYIGDAQGMESSGTIVRKGERVKNFKIGDPIIAAFPGAFSSYAIVPARFVMHKPKILKFEDAPIMIGFLTAWYCLMEQGRLQPREKVLIHSASGGVGLAAIQVARHVGAEIFATAGSQEKRDYLKSIGIQNVYHSRTLEFADQIRKDTKGYGVDVLIGAVSGDILQQSFSLLAPYGRYLEIGKKDIAENNPLYMRTFNENVSFYGVDIDRILADRPQVVQRLFKKIRIGFEDGFYQPIPTQVFSASEVHKAFQYMAKSHHIGKIVVTFKDQSIWVRKKVSLNGNLQRDATYLIAGGTSGVGLAISQWLSEQNVKQLVIISRNGKVSPVTQKAVSAINQNGTEVYRACVDITDEGQVANLFRVIKTSMPPLRGVFHCAAVLDDALLIKQNKNRFENVMAPKVKGTMLLHQFSKESALDFFVSFSSISSLIGNPGQANYAAANAFLDSFAHFSRAQGLPATTINWGTFSDQGIVARNGELRRLFEDMGIRTFNNTELFRILEVVLTKKPTQVGAFSVDWQKWTALNGGKPRSSLFTDLVDHSNNGLNGNQTELLKKFGKLDGPQRYDYLLRLIKQHIANVLRFPIEKIDVHCSIEKMGIDSLMATELRLIILKEFGLELSTAALLQNITIAQICERILNYLDHAVNRSNGALQQIHVVASTEQNSKTVSNPHSQADEQQPKPIIKRKAQKVPKPGNAFKSYSPYLDLRQRMSDLRKKVEQCGIIDAENPYFRVYDGITNHTTRIHGEEYINFSSYNYLGLSGHPSVSAAAKQAISKYGTSVSASRMVSGERSIHQELENELANILGVEAAIAFVSGHSTNVTTIGHLFGSEDLIVHDSFIHDSIIQGCMLSGAKRLSFPHNDPRALENLLQRHRDGYDRLLVVIEGIYSMDGDIPELPRFIDIKQRYGGLLMVDEAHSLGVLGKKGFGIGEYYGMNPNDVDLWMGTLSKSLASCGGYIAGCNELIEYLKYTAPGFRYSVGISPANAAAALAAIGILKNEPKRVHALQKNLKLFSALARQKSLDLTNSEDSSIIPIIVGDSNKALRLSHHLFTHKINVQPILYPAVSEDTARLRFFINALHTDEQIRFTVDTVARELDNL